MKKYKCYVCNFETNHYDEKIIHHWETVRCCVHLKIKVKEDSKNVCGWCGVGVK